MKHNSAAMTCLHIANVDGQRVQSFKQGLARTMLALES